MEANNIRIQYLQSGIIKVIINTYTRWCDHSLWQGYDGWWVFEERDEEGFTFKTYSFDVEFKDGVGYTRISDQEKDQTYVYFIPSNLLD